MNKYLTHDSWCIIEDGFHPDKQLASESIFSIANGHVGQRANFEEHYSGETMSGSYVAGIYFPEKPERGNWKNGYCNNDDKIINAPNWSGISVRLNDERLDMGEWDVQNFRRILNMREGVLERSFEATSLKGNKIRVSVKRFLSMAENEIGAINYSVTSLNYEGRISFIPFIDGDVRNMHTNYNESFWNVLQTKTEQDVSYLWAQTRRLDFHVCCALTYVLYKNNEQQQAKVTKIEKERVAGFSIGADVRPGDTLCLNKYVAVVDSLNHPREELTETACKIARKAKTMGWNQLFAEHRNVWAERWAQSDIVIEGDVAAQQAIRYNIFQLHQTYTGNDARLNISPKGFTGEKYAGATRWDTEIICIPFFLCTAPAYVSRNLLLYRYKQLPKAIANAKKIGLGNGAAFFPLATFNGDESHNEWEYTFEEIHRNGAIAYAIYKYVDYTGDTGYLEQYGLETLIAIARFWAQRVSYSKHRHKYMLLGVTGPNLYENNINNNWYTNYIARWCLQYTIDCITKIKKENFRTYKELCQKVEFNEKTETGNWLEVINNMYLPEDKENGIFLQQDGFWDKEFVAVKDIPQSQLPVNQNWTWDRIMRSSVIKQADVIQGLYLFEDDFTKDIIRRNFDFYEPLTVHESSLSPGLHSIVASCIGNGKRAYELYLRTARLDLDDYNSDVANGLHITSMAGTWLSVVQGFGGLRIKNGHLHLSPQIPEQWNAFEFHIVFRDNLLGIRIEKQRTIVSNITGGDIDVVVNGHTCNIAAGEKASC